MFLRTVLVYFPSPPLIRAYQLSFVVDATLEGVAQVYYAASEAQAHEKGVPST